MNGPARGDCIICNALLPDNMCMFHCRSNEISKIKYNMQPPYSVNTVSIGIQQSISCINVCKVSRKMMKNETESQRFSHLKRKCMKK